MLSVPHPILVFTDSTSESFCIRNCHLRLNNVTSFPILKEKEEPFSTNDRHYFSLLIYDRNILSGIRRSKIRKKILPFKFEKILYISKLFFKESKMKMLLQKLSWNSKM
jgi:hypothetical protein